MTGALFLQAGNGLVFAQNTVLLAPAQSKRTAADILPDKLADASASNSAKSLKESDLLPLIGKKLDIAKEFGLTSAAIRTYKSGNLKTTVTIFQLDTPSHAYGLFSGWGDGQQVTGEYPPQGKTTPAGLFYWQSRYLVQIAADAKAATDESRDSIKQIANAVSEKIGGGINELPGVMAHLPQDGLVAGSERYVVGTTGFARFAHYPDSAQVDFTGGTEVAIGDYNLNGEP